MSRSPTLKQLKYLVAVSDQHHFGQAAKACHVTQSTLSAGIHDLEINLDTVLVDRTHKQAQLTAVGEEVLARSRLILAAVDDLVDAACQGREPLSERIRLGVIPTVAPFLLPPLLKWLREEYPALQLFIREDLTAPLVDALQQGDMDLLLIALPYHADGVESRHLFYDDFLLAYYPNHALETIKALRTSDLKGQDLLLLEDGHCLRDHALDACQLSAREVRVPFQATSLNTIVQMVANGIGITLLPRMALQSNILAGTDVRTRPFEESGVWRSIGLMWRRHSPRADEFDLLGQRISALHTP